MRHTDIFPTGRNSTIMLVEPETTTPGGIILTTPNAPKVIGEVIRVGLGVTEFTVGDKVIFKYENVHTTTLNNILLVPEDSVLAVIR